MQLKWKHDHLAAVISIMYAVHVAEPFVLDQDAVITRVTDTSVAIMSWSYTGTLPSALLTRQVEKKNSDSFEAVLNYFPITNSINLFRAFENKNVSYMEDMDIPTMTVYGFEEQFHGEYRLIVEPTDIDPATSGPTIFYLCLVPEEAKLTGPDSPTLGTNITMTCAAESNSLGKEHRKNVTRIYYWKVNNTQVVAGDDYEFKNNIEENSVNSSLIIKIIRAEMNGNNYTCFAVEDGCEMDSPLSSPYMLQAEDPNTLTSSLAPDDTSISTDTPLPTEDPNTLTSSLAPDDAFVSTDTPLSTEDPPVTQPSSSPTVTTTPAPQSGWNHWYILLIALGCLVILVVIAFVIHRRTQRKDDDLSPVTELKSPSVHAAPADHVRANTADYRPSQHQQPRREDNTAYYVHDTSGARL